MPHFKHTGLNGNAQAENQPSASRRRILLVIGLAGGAAITVLILAPLFIPDVSVRRVRTDWECINNLRQIDGAKEQWIMNTRQTIGAPSDLAAINNLIKYGEPKCPEGGTYTYGDVGQDPRCSIKGHQLP
jgi:hypothetical protein